MQVNFYLHSFNLPHVLVQVLAMLVTQSISACHIPLPLKAAWLLMKGFINCQIFQPLISVFITWYRTCWRQVWLQLYSPAYLFPRVLQRRLFQRLKYIIGQRSGGAAPADNQYQQVLNMQGQIAGATPFFQLFIYMDNCLQFRDFLPPNSVKWFQE